jgi:hypothetical protein
MRVSESGLERMAPSSPALAAPSIAPPAWPDALLVGICALLLLIELFLPPLIGLANNGDFGKIIRRLSLDMDRSQNLQYFVSQYQHVPTSWNSHLPMSEVPLAKLALALARLTGHRDVFDVRYLAFLHCVLLLLALYGFLRLLRDQPLWFRFALGALPVCIFTDVMYAAYFNSFYADTMALLSMLLMVVLASHIISFREAPPWMWIAFAAAALVFITSTRGQFSASNPSAPFLLLERFPPQPVCAVPGHSVLWYGNRGCGLVDAAGAHSLLAACGCHVRWAGAHGNRSIPGGLAWGRPGYRASFVPLPRCHRGDDLLRGSGPARFST